jgi:hypothetical protein
VDGKPKEGSVPGRLLTLQLPTPVRKSIGRLTSASACAMFAMALALGAQDPVPRATPESVGLASAPLWDATALLRRFVD